MHIITFLGFEINPEKYEYLINIPREKLLSWLEAGISILPNFAMALITLLLFYPFARCAKWGAGKIFFRKTDNLAVKELFKNFVFLLVLMIGVFSALEILNLEKTVTSLLAGAGVVGLALGFAFQEIASNFVSGILITFRKPYKVGDVVEVQNRRGFVKRIDLRTTSIFTSNGLEIIIPNKTMFTDTIINYTSTPERRVELVVGISYNDDLKKVEEVVRKAIETVPEVIQSMPIDFFFLTFNQSSIDFKISFWVRYPGNSDYEKATHHAVVAIKQAFQEHNITIPYPTRNIIQSNSV